METRVDQPVLTKKAGGDEPPGRPPGPYLLQDVLDRNAEWIIPGEWRALGAAECLRRVREMRVRNLRMREEIAVRFAEDEAFREEEMARCAEDLVYWCVRWAWLYNADARQSIPFLPIDFQVKEALYPFYLDQYTPLDEDSPEADKRHHMAEKPRKVGFTYCILFGGAWAMCFHHRWPCRDKGAPHVGGIAADVKENVKDRENPESHLGRLEQILTRLPRQMLPGPIRGGAETDGAEVLRGPKRRKGDTFGESKISFPENKSFIIARAAGRNVGRAGRYSWFLFDEEEFAEKARGAVRSLMDATSCLWRVSSVNGKGNTFHRDFGNERLRVTRHKIRYWMVPWYDDAWLKVQRETRSEEDFQREILCNRDSHSGAAYWSPPWAEPVNVVEAEHLVAPGQTLWIGLDIGKADGAGLLYLQRDPATEMVVSHGMVYRRMCVLEWLVPFLTGEFREKNLCGDRQPAKDTWHPLDRAFVERVAALRQKAGKVRIVAGSDAKQESMHYDSLVVQMRRMWGITVTPVRLNDKREAIERVKFMVPYLRISRKVNALAPGQYDDDGGAPFTFSDVMYQYRKKTDRQTEDILPSGLPVHDQFSNPADALQYLVAEMPRVMRRTPAEVARAEAAERAAEQEEQRSKAAQGLFRGLFGRQAVRA